MGKHTDHQTSTTQKAAEGFDARLPGFVVGLMSGDLLLICIGAVLGINPLVVLLAHVLLLAGCSWCFSFAHSRDQTHFTFSLMLILVAGPLGGVGIMLIGLAERSEAAGQDILEAWYGWLSGEEQPDPTSQIHEGIHTGRQFKPSLEGPRNFADIIDNGTLAEKQALLGQICLRYHRDYSAVLASALRSPQSAVRAQAAAVFIKLKDHFRRRLDAERHGGRTLRCGKDVSAMFACARSILECAESGFLDSVDVREALADAKALCLNAQSFSSASDEAAVVLCQIMAKAEEDDALLDRLVQCAPVACSELKRRLALSLVAAGRHMDLHRLLFAASDPAAQRPALPAPRCS